MSEMSSNPADLPWATDADEVAAAQNDAPGALAFQVSHALGREGLFAQALPEFHYREQQQQMATAVARAIETRTVLLAEAGTGTGKTYAYLVPALLSGGKVIVSTGTKTLQDQLFHRDLPLVRDVLKVPVEVALLKGRANYVCHYHLERTEAEGRLASREQVSQLQKIARFIKRTQTGDKAELAAVPDDAPIWSRVTSTRDNCLGNDCPYHKDCFVMAARKAAMAADVVVVNHHLFFADVMLRDTGIAELLPACNTVICDEAHQLPDTATTFFGEAVSGAQLNELARDTEVEALTTVRDYPALNQAAGALAQQVRELRLALGERFGREPTRRPATDFEQSDEPQEALAKLAEALDELAGHLDNQAERSEELATLARRAEELQARLSRWRGKPRPAKKKAPEENFESGEAAPAEASGATESPAPADPGATIRWFETTQSNWSLQATPLEIGPIFRKQIEAQARAWVFTSATLAVKRDFSLFQHAMGLEAATTANWESPFDYPNQALLYVPTGLPDPRDAGHTEAVIRASLPILRASGGRAFLLFTSLRALERARDYLKAAFADEGLDYPLLVQGEASRGELLRQFRFHGNAVLLGSQSFWEGVDVKGEALSVVIIDKLPFQPPDDPVLVARMRRLEQSGGKPFFDHQLPQAVISLKQGAGRLIRSETDRGVLAIMDPRLVDKPYGKRIWQSLPPMRRTRELAVVEEFLAHLAAPSAIEEAGSAEGEQEALTTAENAD